MQETDQRQLDTFLYAAAARPTLGLTYVPTISPCLGPRANHQRRRVWPKSLLGSGADGHLASERIR